MHAPSPVDLGAPLLPIDERLPPGIATADAPTPVAEPSLIALNEPLAEALGLDIAALRSDDGVAVLAGNRLATGSSPLAMAYAGHQFGHWVPSLGDGRAILLGEREHRDGGRMGIQLKGAGRTAWSRGGDGRNWLGPVLREYLMSEAMHALGVPTTRALAAVSTGEPVLREQTQPGAIIVRVARSFVRVGTFQYFAARGDVATVRALVEHVIARHYPAVATHDLPALGLLETIIDRQAALVARWMALGFIHGVMNTDNCSVSGDTIDYGPCAFMDDFASDRSFSSIDVQQRYAWQNQPAIAHWNLGNLAQCLLPLIYDDRDEAVRLAQTTLDGFEARYRREWSNRLGEKLGFAPAAGDPATDDPRLALGQRLLGLMETGGVDFTLAFRSLANGTALERFAFDADGFSAWSSDWQQALSANSVTDDDAHHRMAAANAARIPRNHQVERVIRAAIDADDLAPFEQMQAALAEPYVADDAFGEFEKAPGADAWIGRTFCGT